MGINLLIEVPKYWKQGIRQNFESGVQNLKQGVQVRVLHGPGLGPQAGPARSPWAWPGQDSMIFCGPGRVRA